MGAMPRPRPLYLHRYRTRHGKIYWYVRVPGGSRIRLREPYGTPEFDAAYRRAIEGQEQSPSPKKAAAGSLAWLWDQYREVGEWKALSVATRRQRENIMAGVLKISGTELAATVRPKAIAAGRDRRSDTPSQARNFLDCMRGLFRWASAAGHVPQDPTLGVKNPPKPGGEGFPAWNEDEIDQFLTFWPMGTKEHVWINVLLYTGLRRGDAVRLGPQHIRNGIAIMRTEKSGGDVAVTIPILPVLDAVLKAGPCGVKTFICGESGKPLTKESFGNVFREACGWLECTSLLTVSARRAPHGRQRTARRLPSSKRSSAGGAAEWRRCIRARPIGHGFRREQSRSSKGHETQSLYANHPKKLARGSKKAKTKQSTSYQVVRSRKVPQLTLRQGLSFRLARITPS
jgi:integrase